MAKWVLQNTITFGSATGPIRLDAGSVVDDASTALAPLRAAGGQLVPDSGEADAQAALSAAQKLRGNVPDASGLPAFAPYVRYAGQLTVTGAATTGSLTLTPAEKDASYGVAIVAVAKTGAPATKSAVVTSVTKATGSVAISVDTAPGGITTVTFDVVIVRT